jgi:glycerol uptake facilitator-like aquaporin
MKIDPFARKLLAEFLGVTIFLTAIVGAVSSGSAVKTGALAAALALAILVTAPISGGHLNPAVSIYFYSRKELSLKELLGYIAAQIVGGFFGAWIGLTIWGKTVSVVEGNASAGAILGELFATGGLVWLIGRLASTKNGHLIPGAVGIWVFAIATFTPTGGQANPAVTIALILAGQGGAAAAQLVLAELAGMLIASVFITIFAEKVAAKKAEAAAAPKAVAKKAPAKTAAKKAPAKKK